MIGTQLVTTCYAFNPENKDQNLNIMSKIL